MDSDLAQKLLRKTRVDYEKIAEEFSFSRKYLWEDLKGFRKYIRSGNVILDLGCGNGRLYELFQDLEVKYIGIDNSKGLIEKAKRKYGAKSEASFQVGNALNLPFGENKFDVVFCIAMLHHIPSHQLRLKVLTEAKRVLKKGGLFIMTNWNLYQRKYWKYIIKSIFLKFYSLFIYHYSLDIGDVFIPWRLKSGEKIDRYYHAFTKKGLERLVISLGLELIESYYVCRREKVGCLKGFNIVIIAKKI